MKTVKTIVIAIARIEYKYNREKVIKVRFKSNWMVDGKSTVSIDQFPTEAEAIAFAIDNMKKYDGVN